MNPLRSVLVAVVLLLVSTRLGGASDHPTTTCVYVLHHGGGRYALPYAGQRCDRRGYVTLPRERYDALADWSSVAETAGILSPLDRYRILARLAILDERSKHGRYNIHGGFQRWSEYKWAEHTKYAYLAGIDALGDVEIIATSIEELLLRLWV